MKSGYMNEEVIIQKSDGTELKVLALLSTKSLIAEDSGVVIEPGDLIKRTLWNGTSITYRVVAALPRTAEDSLTNHQLSIEVFKHEDQNSY